MGRKRVNIQCRRAARRGGGEEAEEADRKEGRGGRKASRILRWTLAGTKPDVHMHADFDKSCHVPEAIIE